MLLTIRHDLVGKRVYYFNSKQQRCWMYRCQKN